RRRGAAGPPRDRVRHRVPERGLQGQRGPRTQRLQLDGAAQRARHRARPALPLAAHRSGARAGEALRPAAAAVGARSAPRRGARRVVRAESQLMRGTFVLLLVLGLLGLALWWSSGDRPDARDGALTESALDGGGLRSAAHVAIRPLTGSVTIELGRDAVGDWRVEEPV